MKPDRSFTTDTPIGIYWVGHSTGFRVKGGRKSGTVEEIGVRLDGRIESIAVRRKGFVRSRLIIVPLEAVASVDPWEERVVLARGRWNGRAKARAPGPPVPIPAPAPPAGRATPRGPARPPLPADTEQVQAFTRPVEPPYVPPVAAPDGAAAAAPEPKQTVRRRLIPRPRPGPAAEPSPGAAPEIAAASAAAAAGAFTALAVERHRKEEPAPEPQRADEAAASASVSEEPVALVGLSAVEGEPATVAETPVVAEPEPAATTELPAVVEPPIEEPPGEQPEPVVAGEAAVAFEDESADLEKLPDAPAPELDATGGHAEEAGTTLDQPPVEEVGLAVEAAVSADEAPDEPAPDAIAEPHAEDEVPEIAHEPDASDADAEEAALGVAAAVALPPEEETAHIHPVARPEADLAASAPAEPPSRREATTEIVVAAGASKLPAPSETAGGPSLLTRVLHGAGALALLGLELAARGVQYAGAALLRLLLACRALALAVAVSIRRSMPAAHRAAGSVRRATLAAVVLGTRAARSVAAFGVAVAHELVAAVAPLLRRDTRTLNGSAGPSPAEPVTGTRTRTREPDPTAPVGAGAASGAGRQAAGPLSPLREAYGRWRESRRWVEGRPEPVNAQRRPRRADIGLPPGVTLRPPAPPIEQQAPVSPAGSRVDEHS